MGGDELIPPELEYVQGDFQLEVIKAPHCGSSPQPIPPDRKTLTVQTVFSDLPESWHPYRSLSLCLDLGNEVFCVEGNQSGTNNPCKTINSANMSCEFQVTIPDPKLLQTAVPDFGFELLIKNWDMVTIFRVKYKPHSQYCSSFTLNSTEDGVFRQMFISL